jgi:hypothetical protein
VARKNLRYCQICKVTHQFSPLSYTVPHAGQLIGWGRTQSYEKAAAGELPVIAPGSRPLLVLKNRFHELFGGRDEEA